MAIGGIPEGLPPTRAAAAPSESKPRLRRDRRSPFIDMRTSSAAPRVECAGTTEASSMFARVRREGIVELPPRKAEGANASVAAAAERTSAVAARDILAGGTIFCRILLTLVILEARSVLRCCSETCSVQLCWVVECCRQTLCLMSTSGLAGRVLCPQGAEIRDRCLYCNYFISADLSAPRKSFALRRSEGANVVPLQKVITEAFGRIA
jgi:hypothetical protein